MDYKNIKIENIIKLPIIVVFDVETTGLPNNFDEPYTNIFNWPRIVQFSCQIHLGHHLIEEYSTLIKPDGFTIPIEATNIHKISTHEAHNNGTNLKEVLNYINGIFKNAHIIAAHNIEFDLNVLLCEMHRYKMSIDLDNIEKICTMKSSIDYCGIFSFNKYKYPTLSELNSKLFNDHFEPHNALIDTQITSRALFELESQKIITLNKKINNNAKKDLWKYVFLFRKPDILKNNNSSKYNSHIFSINDDAIHNILKSFYLENFSAQQNTENIFIDSIEFKKKFEESNFNVHTISIEEIPQYINTCKYITDTLTLQKCNKYGEISNIIWESQIDNYTPQIIESWDDPYGSAWGIDITQSKSNSIHVGRISNDVSFFKIGTENLAITYYHQTPYHIESQHSNWETFVSTQELNFTLNLNGNPESIKIDLNNKNIFLSTNKIDTTINGTKQIKWQNQLFYLYNTLTDEIDYCIEIIYFNFIFDFLYNGIHLSEYMKNINVNELKIVPVSVTIYDKKFYEPSYHSIIDCFNLLDIKLDGSNSVLNRLRKRKLLPFKYGGTEYVKGFVK